MKTLLISKKDLSYNIEKIKQMARRNGPDDNGNMVKIIAVVKGNAYGLGLIEFTQTLIQHGIDFFAVASPEEAIELRKAGIEKEILLLSPVCIETEIEMLLENNIILTIGSKESATMLEKVVEKKKIQPKVHLKIDTGFGRYGFLYNKPEEILKTLKECPHLEIHGMFSHFSESFSKNKKWTEEQFNRFLSVVEVLKLNEISYGMLHISNSSAFLRYPTMDLNAVRIGSAFTGRTIGGNFGFKKIGTLKTNIAEIKILPKGYNIGYGNTYQTKKETKIAVLPIGHSDGFGIDGTEQKFKMISKIKAGIKNVIKNQNTKIEMNGKMYSVLGQIGMYHTVIDITGNENLKVGQEVELEVRTVYIDNRIKRQYQ